MREHLALEEHWRWGTGRTWTLLQLAFIVASGGIVVAAAGASDAVTVAVASIVLLYVAAHFGLGPVWRSAAVLAPERKVELSADAVVSYWGACRTYVAWSDVPRIVRKPDMAYFEIQAADSERPAGAFVLPRRAFAAPGDFDAFLLESERLRAAARGPEPKTFHPSN